MDYIFIKLWGRHLGSFGSYINQQVERAKKDKAPQSAIYEGTDGTWHTVGGMGNTELANRLILQALKIAGEK